MFADVIFILKTTVLLLRDAFPHEIIIIKSIVSCSKVYTRQRHVVPGASVTCIILTGRRLATPLAIKHTETMHSISVARGASIRIESFMTLKEYHAQLTCKHTVELIGTPLPLRRKYCESAQTLVL